VARRARRKRGLPALAAPFTVAAPSGARIRDRLRLTPADREVLTLAGELLGHQQRADLAERVRIGDVPVPGNQRAARKKKLTAVSSSRWAGAMTRTSEDQYRLAMRCLHDEQAGLRRAVRKIQQRLAAPCGRRAEDPAASGRPERASGARRAGRVRGYANQAERWAKQRRLAVLSARLAKVEQRIAQGRPAVVVGGRRLAKVRHHLADAKLTAAEWRRRWRAKRMFLTADGESGAPYGSYTISVDPGDGAVTLVLPAPLRHLANAPRGRYRDARATGRARVGECGTTGPPRTVRTPNMGGKTRPRRGDQLVLFPDLEDRSRGHRLSPAHDDSAKHWPTSIGTVL
jgi:hypothetical protein